MSKHKLTITIVFEVPDEKRSRIAGPGQNKATVEALDRATRDMLDEGTLQDWILDAAADHDDFDDDTESVEASCVMETVT